MNFNLFVILLVNFGFVFEGLYGVFFVIVWISLLFFGIELDSLVVFFSFCF